MITPLRLPFPVRTFKILAFLAVFLFPALGQAQCPIAAGCTPGNPPGGNVVFGMGILNVNVNNGAINNTTAGVSATTGYVNYSCTIGTTLTATVTYPISIQTNLNVNENVRVWIDYDNNGSFNATSELAFSSNNKTLHTGTITIPATAVINTPLRMRVSADNYTSPVPTPCSTPQYSQVEDYSITVVPNTNPPSAAFTVSNTTTCSPTVAFQNQTQGGATSWQWNFGDAGSATNTSTQQNPSHTYSATGTYTVTLIACNVIGCDTLVKTNYITYHTNVPVAASCTPATASYCCGYGITNVNIGNGLMVNASANGSVGYEDFTCTKSLTVMASATYPYSLTTSTNPQDTRFYIDLNNDGSFTGPGEMVLEKLSTINPSGTLTIPATATFNTPLRLRIISDQTGTNFTSCTNIQSGQAEDYTIFITPNTNPPVADFRSDSTISCSGIVPFQDLSASGATSWQWNFGDPASGAANTSTLQNPTHNYPVSVPGAYTVTLIACNAISCDTITKTNYISVTPPCRTYCVSNGHNNTIQWITNVSLGSINNTSGADGFAYGNYTNLSTDLMIGTPGHSLTVAIAGNTNRAINAWIDFNKDGVFDLSEKVAGKVTTLQNGIRSMTVNFAIPNTATPGPTRMRILMHTFVQNIPCATNQSLGETEDYTVNFVPNTLPVQANFTADLNTICTGTVQFTDQSVNVPTSWQWDFGDGNTSTLQNPSHTYSTTTPGMYTVTLIACKAGQCDTTYIANLVHMTVPCNNYCASTGNNNFNNHITNVTLGSINNSSAKNAGGYGDYTHLSTDLTIGSLKNPFSVSIASSDYIYIYIDLNRDRVFQANELVFNLTASFGGPHLDSLQIPANAVAGPTRMRVIADGYSGNNGPCAASAYYEVEDYTVVLKPDPNVPVFGFRATTANYTPTLPKLTCSGQASFQATPTNSLTTWTWDFGDPGSGAANNTSTLANPVHTFSAPGLYTITLTGCNSVGCSTVTKTDYVNFDPGSSACNPVNLSSSANFTTTHCNGVLFDDGGPTGDYSYGGYTYATIDPPGAGSVALTFTAFNLTQSDFVYIHDGPSYKDPVIGIYTGTTLPNNGAPIVSSYGPLTVKLHFGSSTQAPGFEATWTCAPPTAPPVADFIIEPSSFATGPYSCNGRVNFKDRSTNGPASWAWNFGHPASGTDNTSSLRNPDHSYYPPGYYTTTLIACNAIGCDTISKTFFVGRDNVSIGPKAPTCQFGRFYYGCCGFGISNVTFHTINNSSALSDQQNAYENFACFIADTVQAGSTYTLSVSNAPSGTLNENVKAWIDYNDNGDFSSSELIMNSTNAISHTSSVTIPTTAIRNRHLRMRVISDVVTNTIVDGCYQPINGQVEDYDIFIVTTLPSGLASAVLKANFEVYPNPTTGKVSVKLENAKPEIYNLEVTNVLGQVLLKKSATLSADEETQLDLSGYSKGIYFIRISNSQNSVMKKVMVE